MLTTRQVLYDGGRRTTMQFTGVSDGLGGDETREKKVVAAELIPIPLSLKITKIAYEVNGGLVRLYWDALDPKEFLSVAGLNVIDYSGIGGMPNAGGDGMTGDILLSTVGFDSGSSYSITIEMAKKTAERG